MNTIWLVTNDTNVTNVTGSSSIADRSADDMRCKTGPLCKLQGFGKNLILCKLRREFKMIRKVSRGKRKYDNWLKSVAHLAAQSWRAAYSNGRRSDVTVVPLEICHQQLLKKYGRLYCSRQHSQHFHGGIWHTLTYFDHGDRLWKRFLMSPGSLKHVRCLRPVTGFVPQDDVLHGELTVKENLNYQAGCPWPCRDHLETWWMMDELSKKQRRFVLPECHDMSWLSPPGIGELKRCFTGLLEHSGGIVLRFSHRRVDIWNMTYDIDWLVVSCKVVSINLYKSVTQPIRSIISLGFVHHGPTTGRCHRQCCDSPRISRRRRSWAKTARHS